MLSEATVSYLLQATSGMGQALGSTDSHEIREGE